MQILPIGGYFTKDKDGFIINPASWNHVPDYHKQYIYKFIEKIPSAEKELINSIYLRGSLPRELEEKYVSDIDLFALTDKKGMRWKEEEWVRKLNAEFQKEDENQLQIEFSSTTFDINLFNSYPQLAAVLKTQSVCIEGPDFALQLPKVKPGKLLCLNYRWLEGELKKALAENAKIVDKKNALKSIIRTGFEIVMERENEYTPDLYWCVKSFNKWYPNYANDMQDTLRLYLNPVGEQLDLDQKIEEFGRSIVKESLKYIR